MLRLLKIKTVDLFLIFTSTREQINNPATRPEMVLEPATVDISRMAICQSQTKEDEEKYGFTCSGTFFPDYDVIQFGEDYDTMCDLMIAHAKNEGKEEFLFDAQIYRSSLSDWLPCMVRVDKIPSIQPCDLPTADYADVDYRGTVLNFEAGRMILCDIDFTKAVSLLVPKEDFEALPQIMNEILATEAQAEEDQDQVQIEEVAEQ